VSYDKIVKATKRSIEVCDILGIPNIVLHSGHQPNLTTEEFYEKNKAFYSEFFPLMEQTGVNVLIENSTSANISNRFFLTGKDMRDFLEYVNHPNLKACWDTGHANIENHQYNDIIALGDYLACVHVTDNNGQKDEHLMPYQGTMNIDAIMCALKAIEYKGVFDFECENNLNVGDTWPNPRRKYEFFAAAYKPSLELKVEIEKTMLKIGEYILTQYQIPLG